MRLGIHKTIDFLNEHGNSTAVQLMVDDLRDSVKFDLGNVSDLPIGEIELQMPKLPFSKCLFELKGYDQIHYGVFLEEFEGDVCGQVLQERDGVLIPAGVMILYENGKLLRQPNVAFDDIEGPFVAAALAIEAIKILNCSNVEAADNVPSKLKQALQKKKSNTPLFTYKTLHITNTRKQKGLTGGGKHASPRVHLRRGHIRKLPSGATIWVQPCVVGDRTKGMVHKDYIFRAETGKT